MKKQQNEELQSRREFFKKAAKGALPILGAIALANAPVIAKAAEETPMGCEWGCSGSCRYSCENTCRSTCENTCNALCDNSCKGYCRDSCQTGCQNTCKGYCQYSCRSSCANSSYY